MTGGVEAGMDMGGDLGLDQGAVETRGPGGALLKAFQTGAQSLGPTEDGVQNPQRVQVALVDSGSPKSHLQVWDPARSAQAQPPLSPLLRLRKRHPWRRRAARNDPEAATDRSHGPVGMKIACHNQNGVGGSVIAAVVFPKLAAIHPLHVRNPSPGRPAVGVALQGRGRHLPVQGQAGIILSP